MPAAKKSKAVYVDGFLLPIPKKKIAAYTKIAKKAGKIWMEHGALEYRETIGDDLTNKWGVSYPKLLKLKPTETVAYSWITFKSKKHRDTVNAKVMKDPRMNEMPADMPFDCKKMAYGGFKIIVNG